MTPMEIACRECGAQPRYWCEFALTNSENLFHPERIADAAAMTQNSPDPPSKEDFERAVEDTGLV